MADLKRSPEAMRLLAVSLLIVAVVVSGCVSAQSKIDSERRAYLADPAAPRYTYDGKLTHTGAHYLYLCEHDPAFGDFLLGSISAAKDPRIVAAALTFFGSKRPDRAKFERVVAAIPQTLLDQEVDMSGTDLICIVPLRDWIEEARKWANQSLQRNAGTAPSADEALQPRG